MKNYYEFYHCLANFWLLPLWIGRSYPNMPQEHRWASKTRRGIDDYMDCFLSFLKNGNYSHFTKQYGQYELKFDTFDTFCSKHFLIGEKCFVRNGEIFMYSQEGSPEEVILIMIDLIKARAELISKDKRVCNKLYDLWKRLNNGKN